LDNRMDATTTLLNNALNGPAPPPTPSAPPSDPTTALLQSALVSPLGAQAQAPPQQPHHLPQWAVGQGVQDPWGGGNPGAMGAIANGNTLGFGDELIGAGAATMHNAIPFLTGQTTHWKQDYADVRDAYRDASQNFATKHPVANAATPLVGMPFMGPAMEVAGAVKSAPSLIANVARGGTLGGILGGVGGFASGEGGFGNRAKSAAGGAALGTALGAATVPVAYGAAKGANALYNVLTGNGPQKASTAAQLLAQSLAGDGISPQDAADRLRLDPTGQMTLADVGGENSQTQRLARALVTAKGPASTEITSAMNARDEGQAGRVLSSVTGNLVDSPDVFQLGDALQTAKQAQAKPLYQAAGIPANPAEYANAPTVDVPEKLLNSGAVQSFIKRVKSLPQYADLPDNSMPVLDQVYKSIGGDASEAARAGNGTKSFNLNDVRGQLLDAITGGDKNHPYQLALNSFSGNSDSQEALALGQKAFNMPASQVSRTFSNLADGDKEFFKIGFGGALQQKLNSAGDGRDAVKVIYGNPNIRASIGHVFGDQAAADFDAAMQSEKTFFQTSGFLTGGSQTANKLGDLVKPTLLKQVLGDAIQGGMLGAVGGGLHGAAMGAVGLPLTNIGKDFAVTIANRHALSDPKNALELAKLLTAQGQSGAASLDTALAPVAAQGVARSARNASIAKLLQQSAPLIGASTNSIMASTSPRAASK
jgi:hypothetical protein